MSAGLLDRSVQFYRAAQTDDGFTLSQVWMPYGTCVAASKTDIRDAEQIAAASVLSHVTTRFRIRWSSFSAGITARDRFSCDDRMYEIVGIKEEGRRRFLEITANHHEAS